MYDDLVQLLGPVLIVAAMTTTQIAQPVLRDVQFPDLAGGLTSTERPASCHGTRVGNARGATCPVPFGER